MRFELPVRTYFYLTIALMGALSLVLALATGNIYRNASFENLETLLRELVTRQTDHVVANLKHDLVDLAFSLQNEKEFVDTIAARDPNELRRLLDRQFQRQFADEGLIRMTGIAIFDADMKLIANSQLQKKSATSSLTCPGLAEFAQRRNGIARTKVMDGFCAEQGQPYFAVIVPLGGLHPHAYLYLETDPLRALTRIESQVAMPIRISTLNHNVLYYSAGWSQPDAKRDVEIVTTIYRLGDGADVPRVKIDAFYDTRSLNANLARVRNFVMLTVAAVTTLVALVMILGIQRTVVSPLALLTEQLHRVRYDRSQLGQPVQITGNSEVRLLANEFNSLTVDLKSAYAELETLAREANAANKAKTIFLANMSHELRTPLNAIIGYSELLLEEAEALRRPQFSTDLQKITESGRHLLALISNVLDLSKIESGKMEFHYEELPLRPLLQQIADSVLPAMKKNQNEFIWVVEANVDAIQTDAIKLRQMLLNLLSNAAKFTKRGTIQLRVFSARLDEQRAIGFTVADSGIGLTRLQIEKLFENFAQADTTTTREYGGTGLGLAITKRFAEQMHGKILVESTAGMGSQFTLLLPRARPAVTISN